MSIHGSNDVQTKQPGFAARVAPALHSLRPQRAGVAYALLLLVVVLAIATAVKGQPAYLSTVNVSNILDQAAPDAILAVFMTVVLISGNFDLSVASVAALAAALALTTIDSIGTVPAILVALAVGAVVGLINAVLVQKIGVNAFIVTLGTMTAVRGVVLIVLNGQSVTPNSEALVPLDSTILKVPAAVAFGFGILLLVLAFVRFRQLRDSQSPPLDGFFVALICMALSGPIVAVIAPALLTEPLPVWLMLWVTVGVSIALRFLVAGRNLYAVGSNAEAARLVRHQHQPLQDGALRPVRARVCRRRLALRGSVQLGRSERVDRYGAHGDRCRDPRGHITIRWRRLRRQIRPRHPRTVHPVQWLQRSQPGLELPVRSAGCRPDRRVGGIHDRREITEAPERAPTRPRDA